MKVVCDRAALLEALNQVSGVVASRTPRQQLTCIKLTAETTDEGGTLTLAGTDAEIALRLVMPRVDVERAGEALIPADRLRQIVSAEDHEPTLTLDADNDQCVISGSDATFKLLGYPPADFPPLPTMEAALASGTVKATFSFDVGGLRNLISRTLFATARETSRYAINGVLMNRSGKKLEFVATDGRRLALAKANLAGGSKDAEPLRCIVPTKALQQLNKLGGPDDEPIQIAVGESQVLFAIGAEDTTDPGRALLSSNLVEGTFPPYEDVIPKDQDKTVVFDRDVLSSAVRRAALLTNEESRGVRLAFDGSDKKLTLSSRAPEMGEATVEVELAEYAGDDVEIGFNPGFITDALRVIDDPKVTLELKASSKPGVIRSQGDFTYVVMPVNLQ
ncbi:MAG: DNA polymerase III subunit beta [Planctomycetota bacterium]